MTEKKTQTCYVELPESNTGVALIGKSPATKKQILTWADELPDRYIFTPEELEALKAEWMEEVPKMIDYCFQKIDADLLNRQQEFNRICSIKHHLKNYLDQHYPLPQPPKQ